MLSVHSTLCLHIDFVEATALATLTSMMDVSDKEKDKTSKKSVISAEDREEHLRLAGVIKAVHANLRKKYKNNGSELEKIWREHCQNKQVLCAYADAMHHLAVDHWTKNQETRIDWCRDAINEYFHRDGLNKVLAKEKRKRDHDREKEDIKLHMDCTTNSDKELSNMGEHNTVYSPLEGRVRLLDVGSCFNPFLAYPEFQAVGIDISPATESVFSCDFLHLHTTDDLDLRVATDTMTSFIDNLKDPVDHLPRESFHVIVFSLLLEYFPAPYQRWTCCQKAHELLMYNGILIIITPDSSHQNRNSNMIKSWKIAIQSIGFQRVRYEKLEHLHCMIFRKVEIAKQPKTDSFMRGGTPDMMYIPQDFSDGSHGDTTEYVSEYSATDEEFYRERVLGELPHFSSDSE